MEFIKESDQAIQLWSDGDISKAIYSSSNDELYEFAELMALIAKYHFSYDGKPNNNFSFIANSSLSGGRHPCANPECRTAKLSELLSFACLYADEVYIQNPFEHVMLKGAERINDADRQELLAGISNYLKLKPYFKKGIIKYAQNGVSLCEHHSKKQAKPLADKIEKKRDRLYELIHDHLIDRCTLIINADSRDDYYIEVSGPDSFVEHGKMYFHFFELPKHLKSEVSKGLPYSFSKQEVVEKGLLSMVINPILEDLANQEWHSTFYGTSYLCDNETQMKIASMISKKAIVMDSSAFDSGIRHYLPTIHSHDANTIIQLREREGEAFKVYRDKMNSLIRVSECPNIEELDAVFRDQVLPAINTIEYSIRNLNKNARDSIKEKLLFGTGAVSIGLYSGILPPDIGPILAAIGGGTAVVNALMDYNKTLKENSEVRKNDFYFLWKANH